jgi:hypothetical protein
MWGLVSQLHAVHVHSHDETSIEKGVEDGHDHSEDSHNHTEEKEDSHDHDDEHNHDHNE